jgi:hypothetical protein
LRSLDTATGDERWRVGYEAHDSTLQPVVTGGVVVAYVVASGGGPSVLQAFDVATPRNRGVDAVDLATGAAASSADTDVRSVSAAALVARRGERVTVLAPG